LESVADQDVLTKARALAARLASYPGRGAALTKRALRDARGEDIDQFSRVAEARAAQGGNRD
jgi:enoyl-CoA hydratase/carnithine racemase